MSKGQRASVSGLCLVTCPLRRCRGIDGISVSSVFSSTYHALEVLCGKQVSGSHSIYLSVQAAFATCCPWRVT